jgi:hypothetical protein
MKKRRRPTRLETGVRQLAGALNTIVRGERVLSRLPALETRLERLEGRHDDLEDLVERTVQAILKEPKMSRIASSAAAARRGPSSSSSSSGRWRMFSGDRQVALAARALLGRMRMGRLFTESGPTKEACDLLEAGGGTLSSGEGIYLQAAFDLWNGNGHCDLGRAVAVLDSGHLAALGRLLVAIARGPAAVDGWIAEQGRE